RVPISASIVLISGCQDDQLSLDGDLNGLFTGTLLKVWHSGAFQGDLRQLHREVQQRIELYQSPNYMTLGQPNPDFERQRPFTI
ncbi:MAG: caspase family protein, partial [Caldilineaceae bacterium]